MTSVKTRKWKENIENLLLKKNICGICLSEAQELDHLENQYHIEIENNEKTLEDLIVFTFGNKVKNYLATPYFCEKCVTTILESYLMLKGMKSNHLILHKYFNIISQQIKMSSEAEVPMEKQLMLTIDNINSLNVPTTVIVGDKPPKKKNITQIFLCKLDDLDTETHNTHRFTDSGSTDTEVVNLETTATLKYECPYCGKQFDGYKSFKSHHSQHKDIFYRCRCSKKFKAFGDLINHRLCSHSDDVVTCSYCKIILLSPESKEHEVEHTLHCVSCQIIFDQKSDFDNHTLEHHSYATCQHCLKTFSNSFKLEHHRCIYKCFECKDECIHESYLISYREQHMAQLTSFKCRDCDFKYTSRRELICHVNEEHLLHFPYLCDLCGESFASRPSLSGHMYKKHANHISDIFEDKSAIKSAGHIISSVYSENPFQCNLCGFSFNSEEAYTTHRKRHLTEETQCQFCGESFCNIGKLNIHIKNKHPGEVNSKSVIYRCTMCSSDFDFRSDFLKHEETHPKGTKHVCRVCNESFESKNYYFSHTRKHKIKYDKQCPICFKKYTKHTINRHVRQHTIEKPAEQNAKSVMCDICGALVTSEEALIKHSEKHNEERQCPHCEKYVNSVLYEIHLNTHRQTDKTMKKCSECDYTTKFTACLEAHVNRHHLKIRPYQCEICSKTFYSNYTLQGHKLTHKNERPEHYCLICSKKFISKKALILHTRLHTGETPYPCELCDLSFLSASRKRQHMIRKHFEPSVECQICQKKLFTQSDLRRHIADCHDGESKRKKKKLDEVIVEDVQEFEECE